MYSQHYKSYVYFVHVWSYFFISSPGHFVRQSVNNSLQNISETTGPNSMKLHGKLPWVTFYKKNTTTLRLNNNNNNKFRTIVFAWKNISETTRPKSMKHYRNLHWMTTKYNKASSFTTTTNNKMANFLFYFNKTSETTKPNSINLFRNLHCMILYKNATWHFTKMQQGIEIDQQQQQNDRLVKLQLTLL